MQSGRLDGEEILLGVSTSNEPVSLPQLLARNAAKLGSQTAYREKEFGIWQSWTWAEAEKEIDAFGTVFTHVSMAKIGTSAVQSRATGGVANGTYLFALPGSPGACKDAWDEILVKQLDYRHKPCNFVEIMPRLDEPQRRK